MLNIRKEADIKIFELNKMMNKIPSCSSPTYSNIFKSIQELYQLREYNLVIQLCKTLINNM